MADGTEVETHLGDPGRLRELLLPGAALRLLPAPDGAARRTRYTVSLVRSSEPPESWVSLMTGRANRLAEGLLHRGAVHGAGRGWQVRREVRCGRSRFDFLLERDGVRQWVEVKSVTFAKNGTARFPDAPTARGRRHVEELTRLVQSGDRAMVLFVVQRADVRRVRPFTAIDPEFTEVLTRARDGGVRLRAARFDIAADGCANYLGSLPVRL